MEEGLLIVLDYDKICRLCLQSKGALSSIFLSNEESPSTGDVSLQTQITLVTSVKLENDDPLPQQICHKCRYEVEVSYHLRETAVKANQLLTDTSQVDLEKLSQVLEDSLPNLEIISKDETLEKISEFIRETHEGFDHSNSRSKNRDDVLKSYGLCDADQIDCKNDDMTQYHVDFDGDDDGLMLLDLEIEEKRAIKTKKKDSLPILKCQLCLQEYSSLVEHSNHILNHYVNQPSLVPYIVAEKPFTCLLCNVTFQFRSELVTHHRVHLNMNPYKCDARGCNGVFKCKNTLRQHSYSHCEKKFICEACGAAFRRKHELRQHRFRHQDEGIAYQCTMCQVVCKNRISYRAHLRHHQQGKRFKCDEDGCPKAFFSKSDLEVHIRSHTNDKRYRCHMCVRAYISQSQLNRHLRQHERRKVMKCDKCATSFNDYTEFCNHRIAKHGEWLPHRCKNCKQGYQNVRALERHYTRCKYRDGVEVDDIFNSKANIMGEMNIAVKSEDPLELGGGTMQNNSESSFLYITDMDSQDAADGIDKVTLDQGHFMIIQETDDPVNHAQDDANGTGVVEDGSGDVDSAEHYMLIM